MSVMRNLGDRLLLLGAGLAVLGGMALTAASGLIIDGSDAARAQAVSPVTVTKEHSGGDYYQIGDAIVWTLNFTVTSPTTQTYQWNDSMLGGATLVSVSASGPPFTCEAGANYAVCTLQQGAPIGTYVATIRATVSPVGCGAKTNWVREGGIAFDGIVVARDSYRVVGCPGEERTFSLCKEWRSNGVLNGSRSFSFDIVDDARVQQVTIPDVAEGGPPVCVPFAAVYFGDIFVLEHVPESFDPPEWLLDGSSLGTGESRQFTLVEVFGGCISTIGLLVMAQDQVEPSCTLTAINKDHLAPPVATPTLAVCERCNIPPTAGSTSTPTPAATSTPAPANTPAVTQAPPTVTPTTVSGSGGLTDEQRTQTAVAAARTAAAQQTPLPPRTGVGDASGRGSTFNVALFALGLLVMSSGLGLIAARGRR